MGKSKRNSGPKQDSNRAAKLAQREAERASLESGTTRPFEGLAAECDLVALREFVPSATATAPITSGAAPSLWQRYCREPSPLWYAKRRAL